MKQQHGWIKTGIAPLLTQPDLCSSLGDEVLHGMDVDILEECGEDWLKIRTFYRYEGFLQKKHLFLPETSEKEALLPLDPLAEHPSLPDRQSSWLSAPKALVLQNYADILSLPKVQGSMVRSLPKGSLVALGSEEKDGWISVSTPDHQEGWMRKAFLGPAANYENQESCLQTALTDEENFRDQLVQSTLSYLGTQYRWGGKTPLGIDCSGLCSMAYMLNGILIYRDAHIKEGFPIKEIPLNQAKKGDLLFFPGHVAMYIEDGRYIHSSAGIDGVGFNSLNPKHEDYRESLAQILTGVGSLF